MKSKQFGISVMIESDIYQVQFLVHNPMRTTYMGKNWPTVVYCTVYKYFSKLGEGEAVRHELEPINDPKIGMIQALKKALPSFVTKEIRSAIWREFFRASSQPKFRLDFPVDLNPKQ